MKNTLKLIIDAFNIAINKNKSDWNQDDNSQPNYIKNRPFYEKIEEITLLENYTSDNEEVPALNFIPGYTYKVIWNGKVYDNLVCVFDDGWNVIASEDHGCPFYIDDDGGDNLYISSDEDEHYVVSIIEYKKTLKTIDEKYIPNSVKDRLLSDYSISTETITVMSNVITVGLIKVSDSVDFDPTKVTNITRYSEYDKIKITDVPISKPYHTDIGTEFYSTEDEFFLGVYFSTQEEANNWWDDVDCPFTPGLYMYVEASDDEYVDITYSFKYQEKQIDEMYIPNNIPKVNVAEVGQILSVKSVDENGKPTEWELVDSVNPDIDEINWDNMNSESPSYIWNRTHYRYDLIDPGVLTNPTVGELTVLHDISNLASTYLKSYFSYDNISNTDYLATHTVTVHLDLTSGSTRDNVYTLSANAMRMIDDVNFYWSPLSTITLYYITDISKLTDEYKDKFNKIGIYFIQPSPVSNYTIGEIKHEIKIYSPISRRYIPNTIARKTEVDAKITSPITANVGQILSVKSVDSNSKPTEWEVVDKPEGGEVEGLVEITDGEPTKDGTVLTVNPNAEEVNLCTEEDFNTFKEEIDAMFGSYATEIASLIGGIE